jgi:hypothetical protein
MMAQKWGRLSEEPLGWSRERQRAGQRAQRWVDLSKLRWLLSWDSRRLQRGSAGSSVSKHGGAKVGIADGEEGDKVGCSVQRVPLMTQQKVDLVNILVHLLELLTCGARRLSLSRLSNLCIPLLELGP